MENEFRDILDCLKCKMGDFEIEPEKKPEIENKDLKMNIYG